MSSSRGSASNPLDDVFENLASGLKDMVDGLAKTRNMPGSASPPGQRGSSANPQTAEQVKQGILAICSSAEIIVTTTAAGRTVTISCPHSTSKVRVPSANADKRSSGKPTASEIAMLKAGAQLFGTLRHSR